MKAREDTLHAAADLLLSRGLGAVSMDEIAERASVSKATIYRWWPTKEALALDALYTEWTEPTAEPPDTASIRGDLLALLRPWANIVRTRPYAPVIGAFIIKAHTDPAFATEYVARVVMPRRDRARTVFVRAVDRGEIPADVDVDVALDLLYGALYHRLLHGHARLTDRFVADVVDMALNGIAGSANQNHPRAAS